MASRKQQLKTEMTWDFDDEETRDMYADLGVKELETEGHEPWRTSKRQKTVTDDEQKTPEDQQCSPPQTATRLTPPVCTSQSQAAARLTPPVCTCRPPTNLAKKEGKDHFASLSDEIIICILRWLPMYHLARSAQVCKRWKRLCLDNTLWRRPLDMSGKHFVPGSLGMVLSRGTTAAKLATTNIQGPVFIQTAPSSTSCPLALQYLDLSMSTIKPESISEILQRCSNLQKLNLESCPVNDDVLTCVTKQRDLQVLNLSTCTGVQGDQLVCLVKTCQRLQSLNVAWINIPEQFVPSFLRALPPTLQELNLSGCRRSLNDADVYELMISCPHLKVLDLSDASDLTDDIFFTLSEYCIEHLALSRCFSLSRGTRLVSMLEHLPSLRALDLFGIVDENVVRKMRQGYPNVKINSHLFTSIARSTISWKKRNYIWDIECLE